MIVYIVIDTELGWDNICGVYTTEDVAKEVVKDRGGDTSTYFDRLVEETYEF